MRLPSRFCLCALALAVASPAAAVAAPTTKPGPTSPPGPASAGPPQITSATGSAGGADGRTVTVSGTWAWTVHTSDCNTNTAGVGVAIDWNDPNQPGNHVTTINGESIDVGTPTDNVAHPAEPGVDVSSPSQYLSWRGHCGVFNGSFNAGTFGAGSTAKLTHTYASSMTGSVTVCAVAYFVHGKNTSNPPSKAQEITAGGSTRNAVNSADYNSSPAGNRCATISFIGHPQLTTNAGGDVQAGTPIHDTASLTGGNNPTGTITFGLYGPDDTNCTGPPIFTSTVAASSGNGLYQSANFTPAQGGTYRWIANYSGDANNAPTANVCNESNENVVVSSPNPAIDLVKSGPASALAGADVQFTLTVTNPGDQPLRNITVTDARCDSAPPGVVDTHGDSTPTTLDPGDVWTYSCTAHTSVGDTNLHNVASVCGQPPVGAQVCDADTVDVPLRHPAISIDKTGPATITAGDAIPYALNVTNPGDQTFAETQVVVTDPQCDAAPTLFLKNNDSTPASLDPGDTWTYTCSHTTQVGDTGTYTNVGTVYATDGAGDLVSDTDDAATVIVPGGVQL